MLRQFLPAGATRTGQGPLGTPLFYAMREPGDLEQTILAGRCCISTSPNPAGRRSSTGGGTCTVTVTGQWPMGPGRLGCAAPAAPKRSQAGRLPVSQSLTYGKSVTDLRAACHWLPAPPAREGVWGGGAGSATSFASYDAGLGATFCSKKSQPWLPCQIRDRK